MNTVWVLMDGEASEGGRVTAVCASREMALAMLREHLKASRCAVRVEDTGKGGIDVAYNGYLWASIEEWAVVA